MARSAEQAILNTAERFGQNLKDSYSSFKSHYESIAKNGAISQVEYILMIDNVTDDILEEFIDGPKDCDKDNYDKEIWNY